jgi:hypothetical protein
MTTNNKGCERERDDKEQSRRKYGFL